MHPVTRLASFLVFVACLSSAGPAGLGLAGGLLISVVAFAHGAGLSASMRMLLRLRWLIASILVIYLGFTPGQPWWQGGALPWAPTWEGLYAGVLRVAVLAMVVVAANVLLVLTSRQDLTGALVWWCRPLRRCGLSPERLAVRFELVLRALDTLQEELGHRWKRQPGEGRLAMLGRAAADMFRYAGERADAAPYSTHPIALLRAPAWQDWIYPLALAGLFAGVALW